MPMPFPERPARKPREILGDDCEEPQPDAAMNILDAVPAGVRAVANPARHVPQQSRWRSGEIVAVLVHKQCAGRRDTKMPCREGRVAASDCPGRAYQCL